MTFPVGIVEDDATLRLQLVEMVTDSGRFQCVSACGSAEAALAEFTRVRPVLALVDLQLPKMSGLELIPRLRGLLPQLAITVLTHHDEDAWLFGALEAGAFGYLTKPASRDELHAALTLLHEGGTPMTAGIARRVLQAFQGRGETRRELARLSPLHQKLLEHITHGLSRKEVASAVDLSQSAVFYHLRQICAELQVDCISKAVAKYRAVHPVDPNTRH